MRDRLLLADPPARKISATRNKRQVFWVLPRTRCLQRICCPRGLYKVQTMLCSVLVWFKLDFRPKTWRSVNFLGLFLKGSRFKFRTAFWLSWLFSLFSSVSLGEFQDSFFKWISFQILTSSLFICSSQLIRCCVTQEVEITFPNNLSVCLYIYDG
jgi:hypothetical protein